MNTKPNRPSAGLNFIAAVKNPKLFGALPVFKDLRNGKYSVFFVYAKRARGMMCRYAIEQRATAPEQLKGFDLGGYRYAPKLSSEREWVFTRDTPA